jgi:hypothetical protein
VSYTTALLAVIYLSAVYLDHVFCQIGLCLVPVCLPLSDFPSARVSSLLSSVVYTLSTCCLDLACSLFCFIFYVSSAYCLYLPYLLVTLHKPLLSFLSCSLSTVYVCLLSLCMPSVFTHEHVLPSLGLQAANRGKGNSYTAQGHGEWNYTDFSHDIEISHRPELSNLP